MTRTLENYSALRLAHSGPACQDQTTYLVRLGGQEPEPDPAGPALCLLRDDHFLLRDYQLAGLVIVPFLSAITRGN